MNGLDSTKKYMFNEICKDPKSKRRFNQEGKVITGEYLMNQGITLPLNKEFASIVIELTEVSD